MKHSTGIALLLLAACALGALAGCSTPAPSGQAQAEATDSSAAANADTPASQEATGNIYLDAEIDYKPVTNGTNTSVIGKRASISVDKAAAIDAAPEDFVTFAREQIADSGFNWWTVFFGDGTGIVFTGSSIVAPEYGKVARDGTLAESYGMLLLGEDETYTYSEHEN